MVWVTTLDLATYLEHRTQLLDHSDRNIQTRIRRDDDDDDDDDDDEDKNKIITELRHVPFRPLEPAHSPLGNVVIWNRLQQEYQAMSYLIGKVVFG